MSCGGWRARTSDIEITSLLFKDSATQVDIDEDDNDDKNKVPMQFVVLMI